VILSSIRPEHQSVNGRSGSGEGQVLTTAIVPRAIGARVIADGSGAFSPSVA
jgi:hypothetical protein